MPAITFATPYSPDEVRTRLSAVIDTAGLPVPFTFYQGPFQEHFRDVRPGTRRYLGSVNLYRFEIQIRQPRVDSFPCVCTGSIHAVPGGSEVRVSFGFPVWTNVMLPFMAFGLVMLWLMDPSSFTWRLLLPAALVLAALPALGWWRLQAEREELFLLVRRTLQPEPAGAGTHA